MDGNVIKKHLLNEGFLHVYEWRDEAGTEYTAHSHKGRVSMYILDGEITIKFDDGEISLKKRDQFDVPIGKIHTAVVGLAGCNFVVGEMIKGDS
jgi:quercetin dioxygenase-like cupin family protein